MPLLPLHCHLLSDRNTFFTVKIPEDKSVKLAEFDASDLILHNVSLPIADFHTQFDTLQLESHSILSDANKLSSIFPDTLDDLVHIIVNLPGTPTYISVPNNSWGTNAEDISPSLRRVLYSIEENQFICTHLYPHF